MAIWVLQPARAGVHSSTRAYLCIYVCMNLHAYICIYVCMNLHDSGFHFHSNAFILRQLGSQVR